MLEDRQGNLFDITRNYHGGNANSEAANDAVAPKKFGMREKILFYLKFHPEGKTCEQIEQELGMKHQSASARISELKMMQKIKVIGQAKTESGVIADILGVA